MADPEPIWPPRVKAPSPRGTTVARSAGAVQRRRQSRLIIVRPERLEVHNPVRKLYNSAWL